ncbi:MAG TPA: NAD(P)H-dependent oxidoreductase subunit E [Hyphomicrobium sp.]|jgi:formate dehydrogenase subunit gamma|uniref:NAD(P)H-dependent oxidoreductase subunit E n=1 Tax=Hyphomicrobium sp. TaxID=82 RepID=UPI002CD0CC9A|nr:NAD(P)H-dependent oxidoreductase subunit E [Hyphomicrobium sp.]HXE01901.1 NAD(P)H-dependent oxidoreductase subunit E [Hyphomicrobium sp.]
MAKKVARPNKKPPEAESRPPTPAEIAALATCERYGNKADELLEILHDLQHQLGHIPEETLPIIGRALNRSRAEVHGVVTFYHDFKRHPIGKHVVKICRAESCQAVGTDELCRHAEQSLNTRLGGTTGDGSITIEQVFCLGNCALSPAVMVDEKLYGMVDPKRFDEIVAGLNKEAAE